MKHYVANQTSAEVKLFGRSLVLSPAGRKGYVKPLPKGAETHREVVTMSKAGTVRVLTEAQYRAFLAKSPVRPSAAIPGAVAPSPTPVAAPAVPVTAPEPAVGADEVAPEPVSDAPTDDDTATGPVTAPDESDESLLDLEAFEALSASEQKEYLASLGIEGDLGNSAKRVAAYEAHLNG